MLRGLAGVCVLEAGLVALRWAAAAVRLPPPMLVPAGTRALVRGVVSERTACLCPDVAAYVIGARGLQVSEGGDAERGAGGVGWGMLGGLQAGEAA